MQGGITFKGTFLNQTSIGNSEEYYSVLELYNSIKESFYEQKKISKNNLN